MFDNTVHEFDYKARGGFVEVHTFFDYEGQRMRFDYSWNTDAILPRVGLLRQLIWDSLKVYRQSLQV